MSFEPPLFYLLAFVAVAASLAMVGFVRGLVAGLACLIAAMISLGGIYLMLGAPWIAAVQVLVHTTGVAALVWLAITRLGLESGFTTRNLTESAVKLLAGGGVLAIAIAFAIKAFRNSLVETVGYVPSPTSAAAQTAPVATGAIALALGLLALTALVAVGLLVRGRPR